MSDEAEIWKPVVGYEGLYEVSSLGRVRSLERTCPCKPKGVLQTRKVPARIMTPVERLGYTTVLLSKNAKKTKTLIHLIVLTAFPRLMAGESPTALAREFGVSKNVMCSIKSGKNWFWLTGLPRKTSPGR